VTVCGDTHGQFFDLLTLLDLGGSPTDPTNPTQYLFLGDYVDRGSFSTEVALLLLSYKLLCPQRMWLLRGNHECRHLTAYFNFKVECTKKYSEAVYDAFMNCFDALPLAARVDGRFLCVHGGLGPDIRSVEDIALIQRVQEPPARGPMCDLLWADPMEPDEEAAAPGARYLYNDIRSCSYSFSYKAALEFLKANNLLALIRAHESQFEGYRMFQKVPETGMPSVICIFSAPNYCEYNNKAAIIQLADHSIRVKQFAAVEHPYVLQNFLNAFSWSVPFLMDKVQHIASEVANMSVMDPTALALERQKAAAAAAAAAAAEHDKDTTRSSANSSSSDPQTVAGAAGNENAYVSSGSTAPQQQQQGGAAASVAAATSVSRPLHHALLAHGGAKALARDVLNAQQQEKNRRGSMTAAGGSAIDGLLSLALRARAFLLLPRFLRRRGRFLLVKLRAVVWFRLSPQRKAAKLASKKD
jgi:diadenosine tetraphosphatase ApaH/serine/threonine PP2A family protein phosphatase